MWWDAGNIFICFWLLASSNHPSTAHFQSHELDDIYQWQAWVWLGTEKWPCLSYKDCHRVLWCAGESRAGVGDCILGVIPSPAHPQGSLFWTPYSEHYLWIYNITSTVEATVASSLSNTRHGWANNPCIEIGTGKSKEGAKNYHGVFTHQEQILHIPGMEAVGTVPAQWCPFCPICPRMGLRAPRGSAATA